MPRIYYGFIEERKDSLDDTPPQIIEITTWILIVADAALEDCISHKGDAVFFGIVNDRIRRMT